MEKAYKNIKYNKIIHISKNNLSELVFVLSVSYAAKEDDFLLSKSDFDLIGSHNYMENMIKGVLPFNEVAVKEFKANLIAFMKKVFPNKKKLDVSYRTILSSNKVYCNIHLFNEYLSKELMGIEVDLNTVAIIEKEILGVQNLEFIFNASGLIPPKMEKPLYNSWVRTVSFFEGI